MKLSTARIVAAAALAALTATPTAAQVNSAEGNALVFQVNGTEYARISGTAGNFGIGTTSPQATLQVSGSLAVSTTTSPTAPSLYVSTNGRVGIGTAVPGGALQISSTDGNSLLLYSSGANGPNLLMRDLNASKTAWLQSLDGDLVIRTGSYAFHTTFDASGSVGIGTGTPKAKLEVVGTISVSDIIQVASTTSVACGSSIQGSIRYTYPSDTLQVCTGSGWKSLVSGSTVATTSAASSTGAIQFNSGNSFAGDTANLFWDDTNKWLGVGTATPMSALQVSGALIVSVTGQVTTPSLYVGTDGEVGIGTATPTVPLYVYKDSSGSPMVLDTPGNTSFQVRGGPTSFSKILFWNATDGETGNLLYQHSTHTLSFMVSGTQFVTLKGTGRAGIGTTNPITTLDVAGAISSTALYVTGTTGVVTATTINGQNLSGTQVFASTVTATAVTLPLMLLADEKANGTDGGTFTSGAFQTRTLNTVRKNYISGASLAGNQITLPAGTYYIKAAAAAYVVGQHQSALYNATSGTYLAYGINTQSNSSGGYAAPVAEVETVATLGSTSTIELRHRCQTTRATTGFGISVGFGTEVYATMTIIRLQ